jgi:hypothetical protein
MIFLLQLFLFRITESLLYKNINFFNKVDFFDNLKKYELLKKKEPIILNGIKTELKKNFCNIYCDINDINFKSYSFDNFLLKSPHLKYENTMIYIKDYLVGNGRILNDYEKEKLNSLPSTSNMIIFESECIDTIPYKDYHLNKKFEIINFPIITKKDYTRYIYNIIMYYKYNDDLLLLNWESYNIHLLDFERINMLLFDLHSMLSENVTMKEIHYYIDAIINGMIDNIY